jgi:hypothetical protein
MPLAFSWKTLVLKSAARATMSANGDFSPIEEIAYQFAVYFQIAD